MTDLNPYEQRATMAPMPINEDHPIRFFTRNWQHKHLTQTQWEDVSPVIERMLTECEWKPNNAVGPNETIPTCAEAVMALDCQIDMANRDFLDPNLPIREEKHLAALEWALRTLVTSEVLESRIKTIIGAALTCLIRPKVSLGQTDEEVGLAVIKFPKREAHRILKECMKAFRVLDTISRWDINGFEDGEDDLGKIVDGRHLLACCAMMDMQVAPWHQKAKQHLNRLGLGNMDNLHLGIEDIPSRSSLLKGTAGVGNLRKYIKAITSKLPFAVNNDDGIPRNVGFATAGGKVLSKLAPLAFASAQSTKSGCVWQLIGGEYFSVWLTIGTSILSPLPLHSGQNVLEKYQICDPDMVPFQLTDAQLGDMNEIKKSRRRNIYDSYYIPSIDEENEGS